MTTTLTTGINDSERILVVTSDEDLPQPNSVLRIDDEAIIFHGPDRGSVSAILDVLNDDTDHWRVTRGAAGTTAAAHLSGAAIVATAPAIVAGTDLAPPSPFAGSGSGETPTLADVLAEGNNVGGFRIVGGTGDNPNRLYVDEDHGPALQGRDEGAGVGGIGATVKGGDGDGGTDKGSQIDFNPGSGSGDHGKLGLFTGNSYGNPGDVAQSDVDGFTVWGRIPNSAEVVITEDASGAAGTYSASITVPGGATMTGLYSTLLANWSFNAAVVISIGDGRGADAFVQDQPGSWDVGTTVNHLGLALSAFGGSGVGVAHKYDALYSDTDHEILISVVVSDTNPPGTGIFRVLVTWSLPPSSAATFEAAP